MASAHVTNAWCTAERPVSCPGIGRQMANTGHGCGCGRGEVGAISSERDARRRGSGAYLEQTCEERELKRGRHAIFCDLTVVHAALDLPSGAPGRGGFQDSGGARSAAQKGRSLPIRPPQSGPSPQGPDGAHLQTEGSGGDNSQTRHPQGADEAQGGRPPLR